MENVYITKASGEKCRFSEEKLRKSLNRTGATEDQIQFILKEIKGKLFEGMSTKQIYRIAFNLLKDNSKHTAARYHLKQAIMELGPSGFPFEKYIAEIFKYQGYQTQVGTVIKGQCVNHEVDVIAEKETNFFMIECKYHNLPGVFCDVKVPLYINSRFKDLETQWLKLPKHQSKTHKGWVITNTRFSIDAIQYGTCAGLSLLGWDFPIKNSLKEQIDTLGLYPITCLTSLTKLEKQRLLDKKIVLCKELLNNHSLLEQSGVKPTRIPSILKETEQLCQTLIKQNAN